MYHEGRAVNWTALFFLWHLILLLVYFLAAQYQLNQITVDDKTSTNKSDWEVCNMSKAKDFDSNFVSGAYEVNKERDKRRNTQKLG